MSTTNRHNELSMAICRACGVDASRARSITYRHEVRSAGPTLTVTYIVRDPDDGQLVEQTVRFVPEDTDD